MVLSLEEPSVKKGKRKGQYFNVVVERDADGYYVGSVAELHGCHTQARSLDLLMERVREAIALCLAVKSEGNEGGEFIGIQRVSV